MIKSEQETPLDQKIKAPFTPEQVAMLKRWQCNSTAHPFTCGKCHETSNLIPTEAGWVCDYCDYTQDWAHTFMVDGSWPKSIAEEFPGMAPYLRPQFPYIGPDPLKMPRKTREEQAKPDEWVELAPCERLRQATSVQQAGVPDQMALVWRIDLNRVLMELTWRRTHLKRIDALKAEILKLNVENARLASEARNARLGFRTAPADQ